MGERLKALREAGGLTIDDVAEATGIGKDFLDALERDEIRELPGRAFGKLYIRAYAEVLTFDPRSWIEDYDRERRLDPDVASSPAPPEPDKPRAVAEALAKWRASKMKEIEPVPEEDSPRPEAQPSAPSIPAEPIESPQAPEPPAPPSSREVFTRPGIAPDRERSSRWLWAAAIVAAGAIVVVAGFFFPREGGSRSPQPSPPPAPMPEATAVPSPTAAPVPSSPAPTLRPEPRSRVVEGPRPAPTAPVHDHDLAVSESVLGHRLQNGHVVDEGDRFAPLSRAIFQTRILGGAAGNVIRHVWMLDGRIEQSIPLRLGGPDWRTHSSKTLGRAGSWTVEARDGSGRVLARAAFLCASAPPAGPP